MRRSMRLFGNFPAFLMIADIHPFCVSFAITCPRICHLSGNTGINLWASFIVVLITKKAAEISEIFSSELKRAELRHLVLFLGGLFSTKTGFEFFYKIVITKKNCHPLVL